MSLSEEIKVKNIHHLGILAGLIDEMGIVEIINQKLGIDSKKTIISGQVIVTIKFPRIGKKNSSDKEIIKEILTECELIIDSYEKGIERLEKSEQQKEYYSGNKKSHTRKS